jgi:hypothetical protein
MANGIRYRILTISAASCFALGLEFSETVAGCSAHRCFCKLHFNCTGAVVQFDPSFSVIFTV